MTQENSGYSSDSFLMINHGIIQELNSLHTAALLAALREHRTKLIYSQVLASDGWFFFTRNKMEELLTLKHTCITDQLKTLINLNLIRVERRGPNRISFYWLDDDKYDQIVRKGMTKLTGSDVEINGKIPQDDKTEKRFYQTNQKPKNGSLSNNKLNTNNKLHLKDVISDSDESQNQTSVKSSTKPFKLQPVSLDPDPSPDPQPKKRDYSSLDPRNRRPPSKPIVVNIPNQLLPLVDQWRDVGIAHKQGTKSLKAGVRALKEVINGKFYLDRSRLECNDYAVPYKIKDIQQALVVFDTKRNDANYLPTNKQSLKSLSLALFFHNPNWSNGNGNSNGRSRSMFLQCLHQKPQLAADRNPELTDFVIEKHKEYTGKTLQYSGAASASSKLTQYWKEKEDWLKDHGVATPKRLVVQWMQMLGDRHGVNWDVGMILSRNMNQAFENHVYARNG